jgi:hypothetical protein
MLMLLLVIGYSLSVTGKIWGKIRILLSLQKIKLIMTESIVSNGQNWVLTIPKALISDKEIHNVNGWLYNRFPVALYNALASAAKTGG